MKTLYFVTSNPGKIKIFNKVLHKYSDKFNFEIINMDFLEIKTNDSVEQTALNKAKTVYEMTKKPVVLNDVGLFIEELHGFPGVNTAFVMKTIGNEGIIKLMENKTNRNAYFQVSLAYCDGDNLKVFTAKSKLEIADSIGGKDGFTWDKIVIADKVRFSENLDHKKRLAPREKTIKELLKFLTNENLPSK